MARLLGTIVACFASPLEQCHREFPSPPVQASRVHSKGLWRCASIKSLSASGACMLHRNCEAGAVLEQEGKQHTTTHSWHRRSLSKRFTCMVELSPASLLHVYVQHSCVCTKSLLEHFNDGLETGRHSCLTKLPGCNSFCRQ